jgi:esterase/lipase superfamily enzyme
LVYLLAEQCNTSNYTAISFSPRELALATLGDKDKAVRIWDVKTIASRASSLPAKKPAKTSSTMADILFLSANPPGTPRLALEKELELIENELASSPKDRRLKMKAENPAIVSKLTAYFKCQPKVVHFAGHGETGGELILQDDCDQPAFVRFADLAQALGEIRPRPECIVLNACFSLDLADELLGAGVRCVVGMSKTIDDTSAQQFATGFYRDLAFGNGYYRAFRTGLTQIALQKLPDEQVPRFVTQDPSLYEGEPSSLPSAAAVRSSAGAVRADRSAEEGVTCSLWFGTNRLPVNPNDLTKGFSSNRDSQLHYGKCSVFVPKWHKLGELGSSWSRRLLTWRDDRVKLEANSINTLPDKAAFWNDVFAALQLVPVGRRDAVVFIHGYNVTFEGAALRAAQLGTDLAVPGLMAFFSWPSQGTYTGYVDDEASVEASEPFMAEFLDHVLEYSGAERVHLIAHSMGSRGLLRSLQRLPVRQQVRFGQIILAAPDVDVDVFRDLAQIVFTNKRRERTTLYTSSRDRALASSGFVHGYPRAGYNPPYIVLNALDTIEVTNVDLSLLGHGPFAEARAVLTDIYTVLFDCNRLVKDRMGLKQDSVNGHWVIRG